MSEWRVRLFSNYHPATEYVCRHCGKRIGHDPEMCLYCGPVCDECFVSRDRMRCPHERRKEEAKKAAGH